MVGKDGFTIYPVGIGPLYRRQSPGATVVDVEQERWLTGPPRRCPRHDHGRSWVFAPGQVHLLGGTLGAGGGRGAESGQSAQRSFALAQNRDKGGGEATGPGSFKQLPAGERLLFWRHGRSLAPSD